MIKLSSLWLFSSFPRASHAALSSLWQWSPREGPPLPWNTYTPSPLNPCPSKAEAVWSHICLYLCLFAHTETGVAQTTKKAHSKPKEPQHQAQAIPNCQELPSSTGLQRSSLQIQSNVFSTTWPPSMDFTKGFLRQVGIRQEPSPTGLGYKNLLRNKQKVLAISLLIKIWADSQMRRNAVNFFKTKVNIDSRDTSWQAAQWIPGSAETNSGTVLGS